MNQNSSRNLKDSSLDTQHKLEGKNIIAVASGKGGVGKTCISVSLAHAFALKGLKVLLIDGDLGLSNIDIQLGLPTPVTLANVFVNRKKQVLQHALMFFEYLINSILRRNKWNIRNIKIWVQ